MAYQQGFCHQCGKGLHPAHKFCSHCGAAVQTETRPAQLRWHYAVPLLTNRFILGDLLKLLGLTYVFIVVLFSVLGVFTQEYGLGLEIAQVFIPIILGFAILMLLVMLLYYGNHMPMQFSLSPKGIHSAILGRRSHWANRVGIVLGLMSANPSVAGASLIATARSSSFYSWEELHSATYYPQQATITLRNHWRAVVRLHCDAEQYPAIANYVKTQLQQHQPRA